MSEAGPHEKLHATQGNRKPTYDVGAATGLAAKAALGLRILARGAGALGSTLAGSLRAIALTQVDPSNVIAVDRPPFDFVVDLIESIGRSIHGAGNAAVFMDAGSGRTIVYTVALDDLHPPFGLLVDGAVPNRDDITTIMQDAAGGLDVFGVADVIATAAKRAAVEEDEDQNG